MSVIAWKLRRLCIQGAGGMAALTAGCPAFPACKQHRRPAGAGCPCVSAQSRPRAATDALQRDETECTRRDRHRIRRHHDRLAAATGRDSDPLAQPDHGHLPRDGARPGAIGSRRDEAPPTRPRRAVDDAALRLALRHAGRRPAARRDGSPHDAGVGASLPSLQRALANPPGAVAPVHERLALGRDRPVRAVGARLRVHPVPARRLAHCAADSSWLGRDCSGLAGAGGGGGDGQRGAALAWAPQIISHLLRAHL
jgi:hypothetical protein